MSNEEGRPSVESAASLFASQDGTDTDTPFDSLFQPAESENIAESLFEPSHESSYAEAANLFEAGPNETTDLFSQDSSSYISPSVDSVEPSAFDTAAYEGDALSHTEYYNPGSQSQTTPTEQRDQSQVYETQAYQPTDVYSTNYHPPAQTSQWATYATSNDAEHSNTYAPQVSSSSQYSYQQQTYHNAPTSTTQSTASPYTAPAVSSPHYSAPSSFTSPDVYSSPEIPNPVKTIPDVTAYRPTTMNAYDPPIPRKSRVKARYAPPKALSSFPTPALQGTPSFAPPPFSQSPPILPTPELSQSIHGMSSASNVSVHGHNIHPISQPYQEPWTTSTNNIEAEVMGANGVSFEGSEHHYNPAPDSTLHTFQKQYESKPSTSVDQGLGYYSTSSVDQEVGYFSESHTTTNSESRAVEQGSSSTDAYLPGFSSEPDFYPTGQSDMPSQSAIPINSQDFTASASLLYADEKPGSNISVPPAQNNYDPYAPTARQEHDTHSLSSQQSYGPYEPYAPPPNNVYTAPPQNSEKRMDVDKATAYPTIVDTTSKVSFLPISTAVTYAPYAPSPTLIGANDPLGRTSIRVPVISFGFGGKLVSCFHLAQDVGGFDVSLTTHQTTSVVVRSLTDVIPASAMESNGASFPGPLFSDNSTSSLARTVGVGMASQMKNKKTMVLKWLDERIEELANGMAYISSGSPERYKAEGKVVLLRLLKIMVENDGQLSGSPSLEWSVRTALVPRLQNEKGPTDNHSSSDHSLYTPYLPTTELTEQPVAVYYVKASSLDRIKEFIVRGDKVKAYHFAMDEKLWAHAMLIANSMDAQSYKEVVKEFIHSELGVKQVLGSNLEHTIRPNGNESLRVAYSLFSGQGAASLQELIPTKLSNVAANGAPLTPATLSFPKPFLSSLPPGVLEESLAQWHETASMMVSSQASGDSAALTSLGDYLATNHWFEAAHACYLLSPRTSSFGGTSVPSVRMVLVGSENPLTLPNFNKDLDVTLLSEVVEFGLSLSSPKGQEPFSGLPHLQAYKLLRAYHLAELGYIEAANRYCEAIGSAIRASPRGSQFYTPAFIGELKNLSDRLTAVPQSDKSGSWISRTMTKPSFDTLGSWLEGRFSKIIVGEGEDNVPSPSKESHAAKATYGPFTHYSTISSAAPSAPSTRSSTPYAVTNTVPTGQSIMSQNPIDRAASAIDYARLDRRRASPIQRVASASAVASSGKFHGDISLSQHRASSSVASVPEDTTIDGTVQESSWWGTSTTDSSNPTPTAAAFYKVEAHDNQGNGNFISLMDDVPSGFTSNSSKSVTSQPIISFEEEEEDLGFGNSSTKGKARQEQDGENREQSRQEVKAEPKKPAAKPELKQQSSSWFGGLWGGWGRGSSQSPGPIVANLGEEKSFYYDAELKRWVNKNAPDTSASATPPPPPPRARTASPSVAMPVSPTEQSPTSYTPPPRAASAAEPPRKPPRVRSNLVPKDDIPVPSSAPPIPNNFDPPGFGSGMPPTSRPKSSSSKRNVRSRYVDVFQQNA